MPLELATQRIHEALKKVFYPTKQCLAILQRLVGIAHAHCMATYSGPREFLHGIYSKKTPLPDFARTLYLTGLAGTGKTQIVNAFCQLLEMDGEVVVDDHHAPFPMRGPWAVEIRARSSSKDVLRGLAQVEGSPSELVDICRKAAFREGIPILIADEFQFATGSESANARVAQILLSLAYVGIPFVFVANFSLIRRLQRRPGEEQQRLLVDPVVLLPDMHTSDDWHKTLTAQRDVAPDFFLFDPVKDARTLHAYSAGRKRAVAELLLIAFRDAHANGGKVDLQTLHRAYMSSTYAVYREETEILLAQSVQNYPNLKRMDLWCPIPLPGGAAANFLESAKAVREEQVADAELRSAMTPEERTGLEKIEREFRKKKQAIGKVVSFKKTGTEAEDLKQNGSLFQDHL